MIRHLHMTPGPSIADPCNTAVFYEARYADPKLGQEHKIWGGWRCRLIRWLVQRWMPTPTVWWADLRKRETTVTTDPR
jgi:hypothetical protein